MLNDQQLLKLYITLTPRQRDVLQLVSQGLTNQQTGKQLYITPSVVAEHLTCIYETLANHDVFISCKPNRYVLVSRWSRFPAPTGRTPRPNRANRILSDISRLTTYMINAAQSDLTAAVALPNPVRHVPAPHKMQHYDCAL